MRVVGKQFSGGEEAIDGKAYRGCHFDEVTFTYAGGPMPSFDNCEFTSIRLVFKGPAASTLTLLQAMAQRGSGFHTIFDQMFPSHVAL
jgi:hypothetical protein